MVVQPDIAHASLDDDCLPISRRRIAYADDGARSLDRYVAWPSNPTPNRASSRVLGWGYFGAHVLSVCATGSSLISVLSCRRCDGSFAQPSHWKLGFCRDGSDCTHGL